MGTAALNVPTWAGVAINGTAFPCGRAVDKCVQVSNSSGAWTKTYILQGSIDGVGFEDLQTFTAPGFCNVEAIMPGCQSLRVRQTANTSGNAPTFTLGFRADGL